MRKYHQIKSEVRQQIYAAAHEILLRVDYPTYMSFAIKAKEEENGVWETVEWLVMELQYDVEEQQRYVSNSVICAPHAPRAGDGTLHIAVVQGDFEEVEQ